MTSCSWLDLQCVSFSARNMNYAMQFWNHDNEDEKILLFQVFTTHEELR